MVYVEWYTLVANYEGEEGILRHVSVERYSYIAKLSDMYELLGIKVNFVTIKVGNGMTIENDIDLLLIFELYKDRHVIPLTIIPLAIAIVVQTPSNENIDRQVKILIRELEKILI